MNNGPNAVWVRRFGAEFRLKIFLLIVLNLIVWLPYVTLQHVHFFPVTEMPLTFIDRLVPFTPSAVWVYFSIYALLPIGPFLLTNRDQILRYSRGVVAMGLIAAGIFIFWPTICARPPEPFTDPLYRILISLDGPYHAFPSLHAAFAIYSCLCVIDVGRTLGWSSKIKLLWGTWTASILYATLATQQHVLTDIVAGSLLGFGAYHSCCSECLANSNSSKKPNYL